MTHKGVENDQGENKDIRNSVGCKQGSKVEGILERMTTKLSCAVTVSYCILHCKIQNQIYDSNIFINP